jgi:hypothetical protein
MKPIIIAPIVALALAGAGAGAYFLATGGGEEEEAAVAQPTPTPDPSASATAAPTATPEPTRTSAPLPDDWETYVDPELGFSFPHPKGLTATVDISEPPAKAGDPATRLLTFRDSAGRAVFGLAIIPSPGVALSEWIGEFDPCVSQADGQDSLENRTIGGKSGLWCPFNQLGQPNPIFYIERDGVIFSLGPILTASIEEGTPVPPRLTEDGFERIVEGFGFSE